MNTLAGDPQRLAARDDEVGFRSFTKDAIDQRRGRLDDMFAVVEHDQQSFVAQQADHRRCRIVGAHAEAQCRHDGADDQ